MSKTFTLADAEKEIRRTYERLYREAAKGQSMRMYRSWYEEDVFNREELNELLELIRRLADEIGTPEPEHLRQLRRGEMIKYLHADLWAAERRLLSYETIPKPPRHAIGREEEINRRNYDVALVRLIYEAFPDEPRKLTWADLLVEDYDAATLEATASEPVRDDFP